MSSWASQFLLTMFIFSGRLRSSATIRCFVLQPNKCWYQLLLCYGDEKISKTDFYERQYLLVSELKANIIKLVVKQHLSLSFSTWWFSTTTTLVQYKANLNHVIREKLSTASNVKKWDGLLGVITDSEVQTL